MRYGGIDLLRHLFVLAVIFQHMTSRSRYGPEVNGLITSVTYYIDSAVMGFFMISGLFFKPSTSIRNWFWKMFPRLMLPFFIFSLLYTLLEVILRKDTLINGLINTITLRGEGMQLYFLSYLFGISFLFTLSYLVSVRLKIPLLITIVAIDVACIALTIAMPIPYSTGNDPKLLSLYMLCFGIGFGFSKALQQGLNRLMITVFLVSTLGLAMGTFDYRFYKVTILTLLLLAAIWTSIRCLALQRNFPGSGGIYLLHTPILNFTVSALLFALGISGYYNLFFAWGLTYIICFFITLVFIRFIPQKWILLE